MMREFQENQNLFLLSGLISIGFFIFLMFYGLYYSYKINKIMSVRTEKADVEVLLYIEPPKPKDQKLKKAKHNYDTIPLVKEIKKEAPKEQQVLPPKPKEITKIEQQVISPKRENPLPKPQSISSLFDKVDVPNFDPPDNDEAPEISNQVMKRLKNKLGKTETPLAYKDYNSTYNKKYTISNNNIYKTQNLVLKHKDVEVTSSNLEKNSEKGIYNEFYSKIKNFLYNKWQPSIESAGNKAKIRFILNKHSELISYRVILYSGSDRFNSELDYFLESLNGTKFPVKVTQERVAFEVFIGAKE
jgi:hypothetical protein